MSKIDWRFRLRQSKIHGLGCFTIKGFRRGQFICKYEGERISYTEAKRRIKNQLSCRICYVNSPFAIDGNRGGNGTHYINHSCQPNCHTIVTEHELLIYALRKIHSGEEL